MNDYTLWVSFPHYAEDGDITICSFSGKYRTFFWSTDQRGLWYRISLRQKLEKLYRWLDTVEIDLDIILSIWDYHRILLSIFPNKTLKEIYEGYSDVGEGDSNREGPPSY